MTFEEISSAFQNYRDAVIEHGSASTEAYNAAVPVSLAADCILRGRKLSRVPLRFMLWDGVIVEIVGDGTTNPPRVLRAID